MQKVLIEARLTGVETNPHDHRDPWEAKLHTKRGGTVTVPITAAQALVLGPLLGAELEIEISQKKPQAG